MCSISEVNTMSDSPGRVSERFRLRSFLDQLKRDGGLDVQDDPMDLADIAALLDATGRPVLFSRVGREQQELAANVMASRAAFAKAFGVARDQVAKEILSRLAGKPEVFEVSRASAPVQEIVQTGADADLTSLPVHLQHGFDGGPYISAALDYARDSQTGRTNLGARRLMLRGRSTAGVDLVAPSDLRAIYEASAARGEPLPVSFVIGCHPIDHVAATLRVPGDELDLVSKLRAEPLAVVKGVTNDIRVPADAEIVLEGFLDPRGHVEPEGPYGEFLGYYGAVKRNPLFHLTAITRRRDALFQTVTIGGRTMSRTDTAQISALRTEVMVWRALETAVREPVAVYATTSSGGSFNVRISLRQRVPGEARNAILAALGSLANIKNVFVVDPDIDIFSDEQIDWALATRFQGDRDLVVQPGLRTLPLDPSLEGARVGTKTGFDLTWAFGRASRLETSIPEPPVLDGRAFASIAVALADGPKFFAELMAAIGSRDGREVVVALEDLTKESSVSRDEKGRYLLGAKEGAANAEV
jgi:2,5-furandicarboxylate decarboxylase 1